MEDRKINFYETLKIAKENGIDALDLSCAMSAEWFVKYYCGIKEDNDKYKDYFNSIGASIRKTYLEFDTISFEDIEGYLMSLKEDEYHLSINDIAKHLCDFVADKWEPEEMNNDNEMEM